LKRMLASAAARRPWARLLVMSTAMLTLRRATAWSARPVLTARALLPSSLRAPRTAPGRGSYGAPAVPAPRRSVFPPTSVAGSKVALARGLAAMRTDYDVEQMRLLDADECIIVNEGDQVLGHGSKKFCHLMENIAAGNALHRAFSVFLFSTDGKLLLQKRSSHKILFPNRWTNTCCSHPLYNREEMDNPPSPDARGVRIAAVRKLAHELGIPAGAVPAESMHYMTRIVYKAAVGEDDTWGEHEVDYILLATANVECRLNPNEVSEIRYVAKEELSELLEQEQRNEIMLSPWFKAVAQKWLPMWWDALLEGKIDTVKDTDTIHILS